jgi:hypothetical protein
MIKAIQLLCVISAVFAGITANAASKMNMLKCISIYAKEVDPGHAAAAQKYAKFMTSLNFTLDSKYIASTKLYYANYRKQQKSLTESCVAIVSWIGDGVVANVILKNRFVLALNESKFLDRNPDQIDQVLEKIKFPVGKQGVLTLAAISPVEFKLILNESKNTLEVIKGLQNLIDSVGFSKKVGLLGDDVDRMIRSLRSIELD